MGKVRPEHIKRIANDLVDRFPNMFSGDFESNKQAVSKLTDGTSLKVRNRIAGYITHILAGTQMVPASESAEDIEIAAKKVIGR